jgi:hypothetical protein
MKGILVAVWLLGAAITGVALYGIAYQVEGMDKELSALQRNITDEREKIHVLQADWTYLARPERIEDLSRQFLPRMQPLTAERIGTYDDIPFKPLPDILDVLGPEKLAATTGLQVK